MNHFPPPLGRVGPLCVLALLVVTSCSPRPPYAGKSVAELETMLRSPDPTTQVQGAYGLSLLGGAASAAVPTLSEVLQTGNSLVRQNAALALGKIGPDARAAVPALVKALRDPEWLVRRQAAIALGEIGPDAAAARDELKRLRRDLPVVRQAAEDALAKIAPPAKKN